MNDALARSLADPTQLANREEIIVEARVTTPGGMVAAYGARVQPTIERMLARGQITRRQHEAGARLYKTYLLGVCGARDHDASGCSAWSPAGVPDAVLSSLTDYRRARESVGPRMWPCLFAVCIEDMSVDRFANERGKGADRKGWMAILRLALDTLADHYGI